MSTSERSSDRVAATPRVGPGIGPERAGSPGLSIAAIEGKVKWFDPRKGFGFIVGPEGQDIFVHYSIIQGDGFRVLKDGSTVKYDADRTDKGWKATRCQRVESPEEPKKSGYVRTPRRS